MTSVPALVAVASVVIIQRLGELRLAKRNEAWALSQGAVEHGASHYPAFVVLHTLWIAGWIVEGWWRGAALSAAWPVWVTLFACAEALRYFAIASLGRQWNTRILVLPGQPLVRRGPYRVIRHPNYVAVAIELVAVPLIFNAWITAIVASIANAVLLLAIRIPAEERALSDATSGPSSF